MPWLPSTCPDREAIRFGSGTLPVQIAYEGLACRMAAGHLIQGSLHGVVAVRVKDGHHPVYTAMLKQFPYAEIVSMYRLERKQPVCILS